MIHKCTKHFAFSYKVVVKRKEELVFTQDQNDLDW